MLSPINHQDGVKLATIGNFYPILAGCGEKGEGGAPAGAPKAACYLRL